ncbi:MAG: 3-deoxy-7-phosphoheptulonate synthase [Firmicutes bacterium]|nr:3-deoxy-7-phosphoheptulonate synthase [Bacillota bacterium]
MGFKEIRTIPSPEAIRSLIPFSDELAAIKKENDKKIADVITGNDDRFLAIVGPCSADDEEAVMEYMNKLKEVSDEVKEKVLVVPRVYTGKPRTTGEGYKGMLHQPDPTKEPNMLDGLLATRKIFIRVIEETGMPVADEMLYPSNTPFVEDLLSYIAVGARSVENQHHRLTASCIDCAVGMKNPTSGDLTVMFNSIKAAQQSHHFIYNGKEVETTGNPLAHAIMRGSVNKHGNNLPNYHYEDLILAYSRYTAKEGEFKNPAVIVDVNHSNSGKKYMEQPRIVKEVLHSRSYNGYIRSMVKGVMIESYLVGGNQNGSEPHVYGKSITDPCLGFEDTKELLLDIAERV